MNQFEITNHPSNATDRQPVVFGAEGQLQQMVGAAADQQQRLLDQAAKLQERGKGWLGQLRLSPQEHGVLSAFLEKEAVALEAVLESRNLRIRAVGEAQVRFVREMANTLLQRSRADLQAGAKLHYQAVAEQLFLRLEGGNRRMWDLVEAKLLDAEQRTGPVKALALRQADTMLAWWNDQFETILNDFGEILSQKV